jgi:signal peptidase I
MSPEDQDQPFWAVLTPAPATAAPAKTKSELFPKAPRVTTLWKQASILLAVGFLCVGAYYLISRYVITPVIIQGRSMAPTLRDGECYLLNRWVYLFQSPERGDLVVIQDPGHTDFAVKRIVGKPGDWLNLRNGQVYLNGRRLNESYLPKGVLTYPPDLHEKWVQLGTDQYYVLGDNRSNSEDSRYYGRITRSAIIGEITH